MSIVSDQMPDLPAEAVEAAARAAWDDANVPDGARWGEIGESFRKLMMKRHEVALAAALPHLRQQIADEIREFAEFRLYDGDSDQPLPGCMELYELADRIDPLGRSAQTGEPG